MLLRIILLLTIVPAVELILLLQVHHAVASEWGTVAGLMVTVGTICLTGIVGAALARQQGLSVLHKLQTEVRQGRMPGQTLVDGVLVLIGAALLLTPGFLTDAFGFSLLIPQSRSFYRSRVHSWIENRIRRSKVGGADVFVVNTAPDKIDEH